MTSKRQIAANRQNSRKSSGPRSAAGKTQASRNALRHRLAAITYRPTAPTGDIERLARAICGRDDDPRLFGAAVAIAENHFARRAIQMQQVAVVERLRDATAIALAKGDNSLSVARARFRETQLAKREIAARLPKLREKYNIRGSRNSDRDGNVPNALWARLEPSDPIEVQQQALEVAKKHIDEQERDEYEALEEAIPDLKRLARYERRAWLRQMRAIREFMNTKLMDRMAKN